jgi:hypothetical protein
MGGQQNYPPFGDQTCREKLGRFLGDGGHLATRQPENEPASDLAQQLVLEAKVR